VIGTVFVSVIAFAVPPATPIYLNDVPLTIASAYPSARAAAASARAAASPKSSVDEIMFSPAASHIKALLATGSPNSMPDVAVPTFSFNVRST